MKKLVATVALVGGLVPVAVFAQTPAQKGEQAIAIGIEADKGTDNGKDASGRYRWPTTSARASMRC